MYKEKKVKRDCKIGLCGIFMLKLQTQGNTLGQRGTPGFWDSWTCSSGDSGTGLGDFNDIPPTQV